MIRTNCSVDGAALEDCVRLFDSFFFLFPLYPNELGETVANTYVCLRSATRWEAERWGGGEQLAGKEEKKEEEVTTARWME